MEDLNGIKNFCRLAILSNIVYECWNPKRKIEECKKRVIEELEKAKDNYKKCEMENLEFVDMNGDMLAAVDKPNKEIFFVFRGTILSNIKDLFSDLMIILTGGPASDRMKESRKFVEDILKKDEYKEYSITTSGHSLGGAIAEYVAQGYLEKGKKFTCLSFNGAFTMIKYLQDAIMLALEFIFGKKSNKKYPKEIIGLHINFDIISNGPHLGKRIDYDRQPGCPPHRMENFMKMLHKASTFTRKL